MGIAPPLIERIFVETKLFKKRNRGTARHSQPEHAFAFGRIRGRWPHSTLPLNLRPPSWLYSGALAAYAPGGRPAALRAGALPSGAKKAQPLAGCS